MENKSIWKGRARSFVFAFEGLKKLFKNEPNMKLHLFAVCGVVLAGLHYDLVRVEWMAIIFAIGLVLITEAFNTSIEYIADFICPVRNEKIKTIKDIAAGAVLISAIVALIIGLLVFVPKLKLQ